MAVPSEAEAAFHKRETCRACASPRLLLVLDLGEQPLANGFRKPGDTSPEPRYPLHLVRCEDCELVQLTVVVDPHVLYGGHYPYRSGFSEGWALHCHTLAKEIGLRKKVLEIGCLDGVMLRHCRDNGCEVQGVDPSSPLTDLPILHEFWRPDMKLLHKYDYIVAQNVFGHVDDAKGFLTEVRHWLDNDGMAIIECPWVVDMVDGVQWDQVYHEHLSYWGVRPMLRLADQARLKIVNVQPFPNLHGGTMRYYLAHPHKRVKPEVYSAWRDEEMGDSDWRRFHERAGEQIDQWTREFEAMEHRQVAAYGASAKLNVFLNALETLAKPPLKYVLDDSPSKVGLVTPGWHIPVLHPTRERMADLDILLIGAANWKPEIEAKARNLGFKGEVRSLWQ